MYVEMDRKPENEAEIQNAACRRSGIIMHLSIFKSARNEAYKEDDEEKIPHGTKVMKELVLPWTNMDRIFCADSYFESVPADEGLLKNGLCFIGIIKTETRKFSMAYLSNTELHNRGYMIGLLTRPVESTKPVLGAFVWMDQNMR